MNNDQGKRVLALLERFVEAYELTQARTASEGLARGFVARGGKLYRIPAEANVVRLAKDGAVEFYSEKEK